MTHANLIRKVIIELKMSECDLNLSKTEQEETMAEFIDVLKEARRVARALEADRVVRMSKAPRYSCELCETSRIMAGVGRARHRLNSRPSRHGGYGHEGTTFSILEARQGAANDDACHDETRWMRLADHKAQELLMQMTKKISDCFGELRKPVHKTVATWRPHTGGKSSDDCAISGEAMSRIDLQRPRRLLLFHLFSTVEGNECFFDFLDLKDEGKKVYYDVLYSAAVREVIELNKRSALE